MKGRGRVRPRRRRRRGNLSTADKPEPKAPGLSFEELKLAALGNFYWRATREQEGNIKNIPSDKIDSVLKNFRDNFLTTEKILKYKELINDNLNTLISRCKLNLEEITKFQSFYEKIISTSHEVIGDYTTSYGYNKS